MDKKPVSRVCPNCGEKRYNVAPRVPGEARNWDRACVACGMVYSPPVPEGWVSLGFSIGLLLVGVGVLTLIRVIARLARGGVADAMYDFPLESLVFGGIGIVLVGMSVRAIHRQGHRSPTGQGRRSPKGFEVLPAAPAVPAQQSPSVDVGAQTPERPGTLRPGGAEPHFSDSRPPGSTNR